MNKISVVLPVYNGMKYLPLSIASLMEQTYKDFDLYICDDASKDDTKAYLQSFDHPRIKIFYNEVNKGIFPTLNFLISQCQSEFVHLWSQDDIMTPDCVEKCVGFIEKYPHLSYFYSGYYSINDEAKVLSQSTYPDNDFYLPSKVMKLYLVYGCLPGNISTVTLSRTKFIEAGCFNEELKFLGDFEMWIRFSKKWEAAYFKELTVKIRDHKLQASQREEMALYKLTETRKIYKELLELQPQGNLKNAKRIIKLRVYPFFVIKYLKMQFSENKALANAYKQELKKIDSILVLLFYTFQFLLYKKLRFFRKRYANLFSDYLNS